MINENTKNTKRVGRDKNPKMDLDDLLEINEIPEIRNENSPGTNDLMKIKIKTESPGRGVIRNVGNSPNRIDKPNFYTNMGVQNNNSNSGTNNSTVTKITSTGIPSIINGQNQTNFNNNGQGNKSKTTKNQDMFSNNLNNIFNAFSNSSLINPINNNFKQQQQNIINGGNILNQGGNLIFHKNGYSPTRSKTELIQNVSNHYIAKERKNSPLKFNALFSNPLVGGVTGMTNLNVKKKEENFGNPNSTNITPNIIPISTSIIPDNKGENIEIYSTNNSTAFFSVKEHAYKEDKNPRFRNAMEDFGKIIDPYMNDKCKGFFSLYDGHGGGDPVKYAKDRMPEIFAKIIEKTEKLDREAIEQGLISAFHKLDDELKFTDSENAGSTACVVFITPEYGSNKRFAYCANVGDSKCVLVSADEVTRLSYDHKCTDQGEVDRVKQSGGIVFSGRVFGQLMLTRALGDHSLKKYGVISTPYISRTIIEDKHKYIVLASDGVWDIITDEEIIKLSETVSSATEFANLLVKNSLSGGSKDNISCIVLKLN